MTVPFWAWAAFGAVVLIMLTVDLLAHRGAHVIKFKEAAIWSAVWVGVSLAFAGVIWRHPGQRRRPSTSPPRGCSRSRSPSTICSSSR